MLMVGIWLNPASLAGAGTGQHLAANEVTVGIPPLAHLAKRVGGERVRVATLIPPGQDPHTFEPSPGQVAALSRSALYFTLDMPFERSLLAKIGSGSGLRVVQAGRGIAKLPLAGHHHDQGHDHSHDRSHDDHEDGEPDPHIWLGPPQLMAVAANIRTELTELDPAGADDYLRNYEQLQSEIETLHQQLTELLAPLAGRTFFVYHPAFGYFADTYDLRQQAVEIAGKSPTPRQLISLIEQARNEGVRVIFVQPQFDRKSATAVARAINGVVVPLDPLAEDIQITLGEIGARIHEALGREERERNGGGELQR